jgi:hypothetical protein
MSQKLDFIRAGLIAQGIPAYGNIHLLAKYLDTNGTIGPHLAPYFDPDKQFTSFATAEAAMTTLRQDTLLLTPESHTLSAALTWDLSNCNLVGMAPSGMAFNKRARIGMSTAFTPMITISGYGNSINNVYTMHGTAAGDYVGWLISGARNVFNGVHFAGPMNAAQGGHASYNGVSLTGSECVFNDCVFGTNTIERDEVSPNITLGAGTITVFNNCIFTCALTDTDPIFVSVANTSGYTVAHFNNCKFFAFSSNHANAMAVAFVFTSGSSCDIHFDQNCSFANVTHIAATGSMKYIWAPTVFAATADELNLLAINSATY